MNNMNFPPLQPKVVLGVGAHPDDLDFWMAGSVARWVAEGAQAYYLILTNGNKGTHDQSLTPEQLRDIRREEQREAAKITGVSDVTFCDFNDGELACDMETKKCIARVIRKVRPDVVLALDPSMIYSANQGFVNHPDHRAAGQATLDAVYPLARDHLAFPELLNDEGLEPHEVHTILMMNFDSPNFYVDITSSLDTKLAAFGAHKSQIDPFATLERMRTIAADEGKRGGFEFAESFVRVDVR